MGFIIAAAVAAAVIAFCFLCYKKAPPTQAIVVTGFGLSRPKVVCGRGVFVLPIVQRADRLNMRLLKIDVKTPETGVKTKEGVSLWLDSVVTVQVYSENSTVSDEEVRNAGYDDIRKYINSRQQSAISNFLGMDEAHINEKINDVLQGNLREIVSEMTVDQILTNRKQMAVSVVENARPDLAKMGLEVVTFNVQDVKDAVDAMGHNHGVIEAIGVEQEELVKKRASIAKAEAERDVSCAKAAAAMAAAEPTSAWQPPSAPATLALRESSMPTAAAHQSACWTSFSPVPRASPAEMTHPGTTPEEPAVGAATMTPMVAFCSRTAMARVTACVSGAPTSEAAAVSDAWDSSRASPPMKPPSDGRGFSMARVEDSRITWSTWAMRSSNPGEKSDSSRRRMIVPMPASCLLQRSSSSRPLANR